MSAPLLAVEDLAVTFNGEEGAVRAVDGISFTARAGRTLAIVGESGCGKSVTSLAIMGLLAPGAVAEGRAVFRDADLLAMPPKARRDLRGRDLAMIFQEPMTSLNPVHRIGDQIVEGLVQRGMSGTDARARALEMLRLVRIPAPESRIDTFPHQLSGGMRQRVMIAMALAGDPALLIADEPTTALDVTIQAQILELIGELQSRLGMGVILITHDLGVVAETADDVVIMYAGRVVEEGPVAEIFNDPQHPYTLGLLASIPRLDETLERLSTIEGSVPPPQAMPEGCRFSPRCPLADDRCTSERPPLRSFGGTHAAACWHAPLEALKPQAEAAEMSVPLLEVEGLTKHFPIRRGLILGRTVGQVRAVDGVSFSLAKGETLALVGESGCGKSTTGRLALRLLDPTGGEVRFQGQPITHLGPHLMRPLRRQMQIVFQDPFASLHPRLTVGEILAEPLVLHGLASGKALEARIRELLERVGLSARHAARYPHEFSGGQRQRIGVARAISTSPSLIVCDEPVSALDVSIQAQVVNLLQDLQAEFGLSYLFIAHDLAVVKHIADRIAVMYLGKLVEVAQTDTLFRDPRHPYTQALLASVPRPRPGRRAQSALAGDVPSPAAPPPGCAFHPRCLLAEARCRTEVPALRQVRGRAVACHLAETVPDMPPLPPPEGDTLRTRRLAVLEAARKAATCAA